MESITILCPNLNYRNGEIHFISKFPIKLILNDKKEFLTDFSLGRKIALKSSFHIFGYNISCRIIEKNLEKGLKINLKYDKEYNIPKYQLQKIGFFIETSILKLDMNSVINDEPNSLDDSERKECYEDNYYYENNNQTHRDLEYEDEFYEEDEYNENDDFYYREKWMTS